MACDLPPTWHQKLVEWIDIDIFLAVKQLLKNKPFSACRPARGQASDKGAVTATQSR
jgi:hypothetical protein